MTTEFLGLNVKKYFIQKKKAVLLHLAVMHTFLSIIILSRKITRHI